MGENTMSVKMKAWLEAFSANLAKCMDKVHEHLIISTLV
jgi:hypothetical protein